MVDDKGTSRGPFALAAAELADYGLAVIPCGKADGKEPSVKWPKRLYKPDWPVFKGWITKFGDTNIGIICGLSGVTIVDIDDPTLVPAMLERFGETPLQTQTPSGGMHLWYRSGGEKCANLRMSEGLAVDIKATRGVIVVPPSIRPSGPHAGKAYKFAVGGWDDLKALPPIAPGSLDRPNGTDRGAAEAKDRKGTSRVPLPDGAALGERNKILFTRLKNEIAPTAASFDDLLAEARKINLTHCPPEPDDKVIATAKSVWKYKIEDRLILPEGPSTIAVSIDESDALLGNSDAFLLAHRLLYSHPKGTSGVPFPFSPKAMERVGFIPGWKKRRFKAALDYLVKIEWLLVAHEGSSGKPGCTYETWLYRYGCLPATKGTSGVPNITYTSPSLSPCSPPAACDLPDEPPSDDQPIDTSPSPVPAVRSQTRDNLDLFGNIIIEVYPDRLRADLIAHINNAPKGETKRIAERLSLSSSQISNFKAGRFGLNPTSAAILHNYLSEAAHAQ